MIDEEVRVIVDRAYARAMEVLTTYQDRLTQLAEALVAKETIEADEFAAMFADLPDPRNEPGGSPTPKLTGRTLSPATQRPAASEPGTGSQDEPPAPQRQAPDPAPQPA